MNFKLIIILLILLVGFLSVEAKIEFSNINDNDNDDDGSIVETNNGYVQGLINEQYKSFFGIPFAKPPTVENGLRWKSPMVAESWSPKILNASFNQMVGCIQKCELPPMNCPNIISEDCLYLNVYTPLQVSQTQLKPVMAYIPGGRFEQGTASSILYTPELMINSSDIVVVTLNYRLGVSGFLVGDEITGNFGFQDQRLALTWIQENIKFFGGDPNKVTLCGQSAGASSIATHMTAKNSYSLFQGAIIQSNPFTLGLKTLETAKKYSDNFAKAVNCSLKDEDCLNALTIDQIVQGQIKSQAKLDVFEPLQSFLPWTPTIGIDDITDQPLNLILKGDFYDVPTIVGTVSEEALLFIYQASPKNVSETDYKLAIDLIFLDKENVIEINYPPFTNGSDNRPVLSTLGTNFIFACSTRLAIESMLKFKQSPIYLYQFSHVMSFNPWGPNYPYCNHHCCHGSELVFEFDAARYGGYNFTQDEQQLSYEMNNYWTNFINNADPNQGLSVPIEWPKYDITNLESLQLDIPVSITTDLLGSQCNILDNVGYSPR
ncbi:hypothetical protein DDB_G0283087 [Dictyostelium discoideum AX4]|uniref:Carboxylic ester hydrolase n=1 Tax=Dictyostelium discoideum TaxID=44689 RepID=Q54RL3_DICDI|nr:hypothetical protein DDB_G0283087 [Dictyostelium discoideum AX4]EAL65873.1 hypothetical protein DDB_G0283087 [Dictyostelium discoideum AX4]|eukprot:XP_639223.1 hypothetical protein DDB_G0283087 [Dictyostelium discoideum AX4]